MVKKKILKKKSGKVSKKSVKKKVSKKKSQNKVSDNSELRKKDFEAFKFGVQRLKELEQELKSLDTRGFSKDAQKIKTKLKNVSEIPNIEKDLKTLKQKINNRYKPKKRKSPSTKKILDEGLEDIQEELTKLQRSRKSDLQNLQEELMKLHAVKKQKGIVDSGVDILVDTNFNQFLNSTKQALSQRIQKREGEIDEVLKNDLEKRERKYHQKNEIFLKDFGKRKEKLDKEFQKKVEAIMKKEKEAETPFEKKYEKKVEGELHKEVVDKFNKMLKDRMEKEKIELSKDYKKQLKEHTEDVLRSKELELENSFDRKKEKFEKYEEEQKRKLSQKILDETHKKVDSELKKKEVELRKQLRDEYDLRLKKQVEAHEAEIKKRKLDLEMEMSRKIKQLLN